MRVTKRKGSPFYWYDFTIDGTRFRASSETNDKPLAVSIATAKRNELLRQVHLGDKASLTLNEASALYWLQHAQHTKWADSTVKIHCRHLIRLLGKDTPFDQINDAVVAKYIAARRGENIAHNNHKKKLVSPSTINREVATLSGMQTKIKEWGYRVGEISFKRHKMKEPASRTRWLSNDEAIALIKAIDKTYLRHAVMIALYTGMRKDNILSLKREQIDLTNMQITVQLKSQLPGGKPHIVPIIDGLLEMLVNELGMKQGQTGYLLCHQRGENIGKPYRDVRMGFNAACKRAKIKNMRFHDLRHTCASWLVQRGVPIQVVKEILGHANIQTTMRYAHLQDDAKSRAMSLLTAHIRHIDNKGGNQAEMAAQYQYIIQGDNGASDGGRTRNLRYHKPPNKRHKSNKNQ